MSVRNCTAYKIMANHLLLPECPDSVSLGVIATFVGSQSPGVQSQFVRKWIGAAARASTGPRRLKAGKSDVMVHIHLSYISSWCRGSNDTLKARSIKPQHQTDAIDSRPVRWTCPRIILDARPSLKVMAHTRIAAL